jgi:predicted RNA binding protein YcfA (HicA-like mRNA interferase family)
MRLPRGVGANRLMRALTSLGYQVVRQQGSHIRMRFAGPPGHAVTIPNHDPIKVGTLHGIITDVAQHLGVEPDEVLARL